MTEVPPYPIVAVRANDWRLFKEQFNIKAEIPFTPCPGWIAGWLIYEDDFCITVALELFDDGDARSAVVIQKTCLLEPIVRVSQLQKEGA